MLAIAKLGRRTAAGDKFRYLSEEDYYLKSKHKEPPGEWWGKGAESLGLTGHVRREDFTRAFDGFSPLGEPLSKNAGDASRLPGWDTVYSAPKSASIARAIADPDLQERLDAKMR